MLQSMIQSNFMYLPFNGKQTKNLARLLLDWGSKPASVSLTIQIDLDRLCER